MKKLFSQLVSKVSFSQETAEVKALRDQLDTAPTVQLDPNPTLCPVCRCTEVEEEDYICLSCEDEMDRSDDENYDAQQEELENMAWVAEMEEQLSNKPSKNN